jgi:hypothetical protein
MKKRFIISESDRKEILSMYGVLNESVRDITIKGVVYGDVNDTLPNSKVEILSGNKILNRAMSDDSGEFNVTINTDNQTLTIRCSNTNEGYPSSTTEIDVKEGTNTYEVKLKLTSKERQDVKVTKKIQQISGVVYNKEGDVLEDVEISISFDGQVKPITQEKNGSYKFTTPDMGDKNVELSFKKDGYVDTYKSLRILSNDKMTFNPKLPKITQKVETPPTKPFTDKRKIFKSTRTTFYGSGTSTNEETAIVNAKKDALVQYLKVIRLSDDDKDKLKGLIPDGGIEEYRNRERTGTYYYVYKFKRKELRKFVSSKLKIKPLTFDTTDEIDYSKIVFEGIELNDAFIKSSNNKKPVFVFWGNSKTNSKLALDKLNSNPELVNRVNSNYNRVWVNPENMDNDNNEMINITGNSTIPYLYIMKPNPKSQTGVEIINKYFLLDDDLDLGNI